VLTRLRGLWRAARSLPVLSALLASVDRYWWARIIRRADIVDREFVSAQLGRAVTAGQAVRAYVGGGFRSGLTLNPLFAERLVSAQLPDADRVPAMYAYLVADPAEVETSLAWDAPAHARSERAALMDPAGVLGHGWRALRAGGSIRLRGGGTADLALLHEAARDLEKSSAAPAGAPPSVILLWHLDGDDADGVGVRSALAALDQPARSDSHPDQGLRLVLDVTAAPQDVRLLAGQLPLGDPRIRLIATGEPILAASEPGVVVVRRGPGAAISAAAIGRLTAAALSGPVAPVWLSDDGTIASAGVLVEDGHAYRALQGFPREDAEALGVELPVAALDSPVTAAVAGDVRAARTLLGETVFGGTPLDDPFTHIPDNAPATEANPRGLSRAGWTIDAGASAPVYAAERELQLLPDGGSVPRMRWAIKTGAPAGLRGESWGETHFARALAAALERLGQYVAVDARPALDRPSAELDDVVLSLRGPHPLPTPAAAHRLLWIISHPDEITADEVAHYDRVFAGSTAWARTASERFGVPIEPLLQCTDPNRFRPSGVVRGSDLVFVGTALGIARPSVVVPLRAGRNVRVYGPDWRGYIPGSAIAATHVSNEALPAVYEAAGAVLNDHWPAMRREGFISNRLYDVVAAGGRAISDHVEGIEEIFGGAVRTYHDAQELLELTAAPLDDRFPSDAELARVAERIRHEHSFDARAARLLGSVLERL
jgi:hypothetical protein